MKKIESKIKSVTVYNDRAMVKRFSTINTEKKQYTFVFENLPKNIEKNSIQVNSSKGLILKEIKFEQNYFDELPESDKNSLLLNKKNLENELKVISDKIVQTIKEKEFVQGVINKSIQPENQDKTEIEINPDKWLSFLNFYHDKNTEFDRDLRELNKEKDKVIEKLENVIFNLKKYDTVQQKINNCVVVKIESISEGEKELQLSYIVYGPNWEPIYDLRVDSETKKLRIEYNALVRQNTGENWDDVKLVLSTAQVQISGIQPELTPWNINFFLPSPPAASPMMKTDIKRKKGLGMTGKISMEESDEFAADEDLIEIQKPIAEVKKGATAVVFIIDEKTTIKSTNDENKVSILVKDFDAYFKYNSIPKLSPYFYLKAKVKNVSEFPLLPGETHIFLDGSFVANSNISMIAPDEEFWTSLGIDESITINYKLIRRYEKNEGLFTKKRKVNFEYKIEVINKKKTAEEINIFDQIPISNHEEIVVELIEPKIKDDKNDIAIDELKKISWKYNIEPSEKKEIKFEFSVESPSDKTVYGL